MTDVIFEVGTPVHVMEFTVLGKPHTKKRHRSAKTKVGIRQYPDPETERWENLVIMEYRAACEKNASDFDPLAKKYMISMAIHLDFPIPDSKPKWWKAVAETGNLPFTSRPDVDNTMKLLADSLNGIAYKDDSQIFTGMVSKAYGAKPGMRVGIAYFEPPTRDSVDEPKPKKKHDKNGVFKFKEPMGIMDNPYGNGADGLNH